MPEAIAESAEQQVDYGRMKSALSAITSELLACTEEERIRLIVCVTILLSSPARVVKRLRDAAPGTPL